MGHMEEALPAPFSLPVTNIDLIRAYSLIWHYAVVSALSLNLAGCVTIQSRPLPHQRTKTELQKVLLGRPDKVVTASEKSLPHGADEMWIFEYPDSTEDRYYFKGDTLIAIDHVIYETL